MYCRTRLKRLSFESRSTSSNVGTVCWKRICEAREEKMLSETALMAFDDCRATRWRTRAGKASLLLAISLRGRSSVAKLIF